ncbi:hypothetical protein AGMMS49928_00220 [Spirochaetia bacterium]|nr:hypothetical protein AGMMS49928_00220 [Spirochaetia bacterium]
MNAKEEFERLGKEEEELAFTSFSHRDAWNIAASIVEKTKNDPQPLGFEIYLNGLLIFRYFPTGITQDHEYWLYRKYRTVKLREMSSMRMKWMAEMNNSKITDWKLDPNNYCLAGGGYPIKIKDTGMIGAIVATGTNDTDEHNKIVEAIREYQTGRSSQ